MRAARQKTATFKLFPASEPQKIPSS